MKSFKVIALSQKGVNAIQKNYFERSKMKPLERVLFNKLFQVVVAPNFKSIEFRGKTLASDYVDSASMVKTLSGSMVADGCIEPDDFIVEVSSFE